MPKMWLGRALASTVVLTAIAAAWPSSLAARPASDVATTLGPTLANVRAFARERGDALWPGYAEAPFGFLLVSGKVELLLCQPGPTAGFADAGTDPATGCTKKRRARSWVGDDLLAAMPLISTIPTIVMGLPATTHITRGAWIRSILHEHFHQLQMSQSGYYDRVDALDLAGSHPNDWQIAYAFPYADPRVDAAYALASRALAHAVQSRGDQRFLTDFDAYLSARAAFVGTLSDRDWRYFDFELWQEGVARWTELQLGDQYPDDDVRAATRSLATRTMEQLQAPDLASMARTAVYPIGAGEAMLMEACGATWRRDYLSGTGLTQPLLAARSACGR